MFCDVEKKKCVLTSSMHSMKSVSLFQAMIYAFIYTAPNYRPKQMQIQCTKKHYRVHRSSAKHSLFIGCMCTQTAIFFFFRQQKQHIAPLKTSRGTGLKSGQKCNRHHKETVTMVNYRK